MIAPATMDALAEVARALGFELRRAPLGKPIGVDYDRASEQMQFALMDRLGQVAFDGTSRECAAFLIGWRDLRSRLIGELHAVDAKTLPEMHAWTRCDVRDAEGRPCMARAGHTEPFHITFHRWGKTERS